MDITFLGKTGVKLAARDLTITIDAGDKVKNDLALLSRPEDKKVEGLNFDGPGEYEVKGAMIDGVSLENGNTAFSIMVDDIRLAHLGDLQQETLSDSQLQAIGAIDVLFLPLDGRKAEITSKIVSQLELQIIVPIDYDEKSLKSFLSETGAKEEKLDKLKLNRKDLPEYSRQVVVLEAKS